MIRSIVSDEENNPGTDLHAPFSRTRSQFPHHTSSGFSGSTRCGLGRPIRRMLQASLVGANSALDPLHQPSEQISTRLQSRGRFAPVAELIVHPEVLSRVHPVSHVHLCC